MQIGSIKEKKRKNKVRLSTRSLHLMLLPGAIIVFIYSYLPMVGLVMAFQKFDIYLGLEAFWKSEWVGFGNYVTLWKMGDPILFVLLLNEFRVSVVKRTIQTVIYMPHFLSWVLLAGVIRQLFAMDGVINNFLTSMGLQAMPFLSSNEYFVPLLIYTDIWKNFGFSTIIYMAAIAGVDPSLYEAAIVDGANRWQQTIHVTLPGMVSIIVLQLVLSLQNVLNAGFDQIFNLYNPSVYRSADIIDTWVYRISFESTTPMYSLGAAVGLFKSVVSLFFIALSYYLAHRFAGYEIF